MRKIMLLSMLVLFLVPMAFAQTAPLDTTLSSDDQAQFDQILEPITKIYNFIKYVASILAGIFLLYAGITYMASGGDPKKRQSAKNIGASVILGLILIWAAPFVVGLLT